MRANSTANREFLPLRFHNLHKTVILISKENIVKWFCQKTSDVEKTCVKYAVVTSNLEVQIIKSLQCFIEKLTELMLKATDLNILGTE